MATCVLALAIGTGLVRAAAPATGFIEVCKGSDGSGVSGTFRFTVGTQTVVVPVDACSAPLQVPAGVVSVVEETVAGVGVIGITAAPADRLVNSSLAGRSAQVMVVAGDVASQTVVTFTNRSELGILTVCKAAGNGIAPGTNFTFVVGGSAIAVPAGSCANAGRFPYGSNITVTELLEPGVRVAAITVHPEARLVGAPSLTDGTVTVQIGMLATQVTFTNETVPQGFIQICKRSVGAGVTGSFEFTVAGQTVEVPVGACSGTLRVPEGVHTVAELPRAGALVTGVTTSPASRLVTMNLSARTAEVQVVAGSLLQLVTVTFTNQVETGQVKVCKVAGRGVAVGTPFWFTVGDASVTVPAGSCALAGSFPVGTVVPVAEAVPAGMEVSGIRVEPPDRRSGAASLANGTVSVIAGTGVTEVLFTNQTTAIAPTTTTPSTSSTVPLAPTTTTTVPALPTTTTTTAPAPTTSTTAVPLVAPTTTAPAPTTSTTAPLASTSTTAPLLTTTSTTGANLAATTTTVAPAATTTTVAFLATTSTAVASTATTMPAPTTTSPPAVQAVTTTVPQPGVATTTPAPTTTTSTVPCVAPSTTVPAPSTTATTLETATPVVPEICETPTGLSPVTTVVGQLIERASVPLARATLALTGGPTSTLIATSIVVMLLGWTLVLATRGRRAGPASATTGATSTFSPDAPAALSRTAAESSPATAVAFSRGSPDRPG